MKTKKLTPTRASFVVRSFLLVVLCGAMPNHSSYAHNKVVVIPMSGDDSSAVEPTSPVAKVNPGSTDYTINALTVIDNITKLEWQRSDDNTGRTWYDAADYCAGLTIDGKSDWRLPDIVELVSIIDYGQSSSPIIDSTAFPGTDDDFYWSASGYELDAHSAWIANFNFGSTDPVDRSLAVNIFVRCVR